MSLTPFLNAIFETGQVAVATLPIGDVEQLKRATPVIDDEARQTLTDAEVAHRLTFAHEPPMFDIEFADRAARWFYLACQCFVSRHLPGEVVESLLSGAKIEGDATTAHAESKAKARMESKGARDAAAISPPPTASAHYSADLTLRYLPDLFRLCRGLAENDPLLAQLRTTGGDWPLSSIGMAGVTPAAARLDTVLADPALRQCYIDRVLTAGDVERLNDTRCKAEALAAAGAHRELIKPRVAEVLWAKEEKNAE